MVSQQLDTGDDYRLLKKVIQISLTDFTLFPEHQDLKSTFVLYDRAHGRALGDLFEIHYIELAKFKKHLEDKLSDSLDCWILFLRHATEYHESSEIPEPLRREEGMTTAMEATHKALSDAEIRYAIEARKKAERDRVTELNAAIEFAEARGEAVAKRTIARGLRAQGLSDELIVGATGLKPEDF